MTRHHPSLETSAPKLQVLELLSIPTQINISCVLKTVHRGRRSRSCVSPGGILGAQFRTHCRGLGNRAPCQGVLNWIQSQKDSNRYVTRSSVIIIRCSYHGFPCLCIAGRFCHHNSVFCCQLHHQLKMHTKIRLCVGCPTGLLRSL